MLLFKFWMRWRMWHQKLVVYMKKIKILFKTFLFAVVCFIFIFLISVYSKFLNLFVSFIFFICMYYIKKCAIEFYQILPIQILRIYFILYKISYVWIGKTVSPQYARVSSILCYVYNIYMYFPFIWLYIFFSFVFQYIISICYCMSVCYQTKWCVWLFMCIEMCI